MPEVLAPRRTRGPRPSEQALLPVLYQHRLVTSTQLKQMLTPHAANADYVRKQLHRLRERQMVAATLRRHGSGTEMAWYCTALGADVVEAAGEVTRRTYRMSEAAAAGQLQEHTFAVNDTGIAFMDAARASGHQCGPLDWEPELAHRLRDGDSRVGDDAWFVPDAVLRYVHDEADRRMLLTYFLEVDRATMGPARLADKVRAYARYLTYVPAPAAGRSRGTAPSSPGTEAWRERYPVFPRLLFVLTGATDVGLRRRIDDLRSLAAADPRLRRSSARLIAGATTLQLLQDHGPWEPIVTPIFGDPTTNALMTTDGKAAA
ncbi:replication-relaxation family protein [Actinacidiphila rubida]|uniref:Replication-relaxation n=1 Tax=Actinacidiphila rubida TaxID=310780 RepID=A0A1H8TG29_9ACTN|nr:replication-relaxation family protein [Actinacidiphila rubida]SEO89448.1 Replication-relaxation [Actinacidiphila rubida]